MDKVYIVETITTYYPDEEFEESYTKMVRIFPNEEMAKEFVSIHKELIQRDSVDGPECEIYYYEAELSNDLNLKENEILWV